MKLTKITIIKNFLCLFIFSLIFTSCEPEELPVDEGKSKNQLENKIGDTGDQEAPPIEKK